MAQAPSARPADVVTASAAPGTRGSFAGAPGPHPVPLDAR